MIDISKLFMVSGMNGRGKNDDSMQNVIYESDIGIDNSKACRCHALSHVLAQKQKQPRDGGYTGKCKRALGRLQRRYKTAGYRPISSRYSNSRCFFLLQKSTSISSCPRRRRRRFCRNNCSTNSCRTIAPKTSLDRRRRARSNRRLKLD